MEFPNVKNYRDIIKITLFKINFSILIDFQKIAEGINLNINHGSLLVN
jgi:hypothetical protein